jgi:site-specific recombinase XerD
LEITRGVKENGAKGVAVLRFKAPKTAKSRRAFKVGQNVMQALRKHRAIQSKDRLAFKGAYQDNNLVFCQRDGSPINPDKLSHDFQEFVKKQNSFPRLRLHDLRHTFATQTLRAGVHFKVVSEMLGHASVAITLDRYSHVLEGMDSDAAEALDRLYRRARTA